MQKADKKHSTDYVALLTFCVTFSNGVLWLGEGNEKWKDRQRKNAKIVFSNCVTL